MDEEYQEALDAYVTYLQGLIDQNFRERFSLLTPPTVIVEKGSKFDRIVKASDEGSRVHSFVVKKDGQNKTLGLYRRGDIHLAASYKQPARTARATIFDPEYKGVDIHGPRYL